MSAETWAPIAPFKAVDAARGAARQTATGVGVRLYEVDGFAGGTFAFVSIANGDAFGVRLTTGEPIMLPDLLGMMVGENASLVIVDAGEAGPVAVLFDGAGPMMVVRLARPA